MKTKLIVLWLLFVGTGLSANAHRLNEYLQATTIALYKDHVSLQVRLTAGSDVAGRIIRLIDTDNNGFFSNEEQEHYAKSILQETGFDVDGKPAPAKLQSWAFPAAAEMKKGLGEILLHLDLAISATNTSHVLVIINHYLPSTSVYLVNCLLPADTSVHVTSQSRNYDQSVYTLNFSIGESEAGLNSQTTALANNPAIVKTYFFHGVKHIMNGFDHLLFLCALVLGAAGLWDLVKIVTAFTIAHSLTLTLAIFGLAHLPVWIVEPLIAASIVFVALQNIFWPQYSGSRARLITAFFFGLFHGLGFAGGLLELMHAMTTQMIWYAILGFSIGVEAGNQLVLLPLYGIVAGYRKHKAKKNHLQYPMVWLRIVSGVVALAGLYYLVVAMMSVWA